MPLSQSFIFTGYHLKLSFTFYVALITVIFFLQQKRIISFTQRRHAYSDIIFKNDSTNTLIIIHVCVLMQILNSKMAALLALGAGPVLSNKQVATTGQIKISLSYQKKLVVIIHVCRSVIFLLIVFIMPHSMYSINLQSRFNSAL